MAIHRLGHAVSKRRFVCTLSPYPRYHTAAGGNNYLALHRSTESSSRTFTGILDGAKPHAFHWILETVMTSCTRPRANLISGTLLLVNLD